MKGIFRMLCNRTANLKLWCYILLLASLCCACDDENSPSPDNYIWVPDVQISKGDTEVTLWLTDPRPYSEYVGAPPSDPDYFNVWISNDPDNFELYKRIETSTNTVLVDNLENGKFYYFLVTAHKGENNPVGSDTTMTIPSAAQKRDVYFPDLNFSVQQLSTSHDTRYLTFASNNYDVSIIGDVFYFKDNNSGAVNSLGVNFQGANWSDTANKLVYLTTKLEGNIRYPFALQLFDPESKAVTTLFETPYNSYYVMSPTFTPDGANVAFLSSENNLEKHFYDLWTVNPVSAEKTRITNFNDLGFYMNGNYSFSKSGDEIYLDGQHDLVSYATSIYKLNTLSNELTPVVESAWSDRIPKLSPDNSKLAFTSDRSGKDELWIYELSNSKYTQITGEPSYRFDSRYTNLEWIDNEHMLITVFEGSKSTAVKINVN